MTAKTVKQNDVFSTLNDLNVNEHTEKIKPKNGYGPELTYLSWAWAWAYVCKKYPDATYEIKENPETHQHFWYDHNLGYEVRTSVTIEGLTREMWLPVMDSSNHAMKDEPYQIKTSNRAYQVKAATMFDVNKAIMRCLTKNLAMFGLGLYIYSGEDLPETEQAENSQENSTEKESKEPEKAKQTTGGTATKAQMNLIQKLYRPEEINGMVHRLGKENLEEITKDNASKMIQARTLQKEARA